MMGIPAKIAILQKMREEKEILFAPISDKLSKEMKHSGWKEIGELAESLRVTRGKPWQYVRDTLWANWKKRTLAKLDTAISTNGNPESKFNAIDRLVLDIVGVEEINTGFGVSESFESICSSEVLQQESDISLVEGASVEILPLDLPQGNDCRFQCKRKATRNVGDNIVCKKKAKLLDLQIEYLELRRYTMSLQALALERRLKLPRSKFTESIAHPEDGDNSVTKNHECHCNSSKDHDT